MKERFKIGFLGLAPSSQICKEYPDCDCDGHYVWEENKKKLKQIKELEGMK